MTNEKWEQLLSAGLSLDHHHLLCLIKKGGEIPPHPRIQGLINLLALKGYIEDGVLSDKAEALIRDDVKGGDWVAELLGKIKGRLREHTGKEQILGFGRTYFVPSYKDLQNSLQRWNKEYKMLEGNEDKIEKILLSHIDECYKVNSWSPSIQYFIIKERPLISRLAAALENYEEPTEEKQWTTEII